MSGTLLLAMATHADLALQVWLRDPMLLADQHNEQRLVRLSSFEHYGSKTQGKDGTALRPGLSPAKAVTESIGGRTTTPPDTGDRAALAGALDAWFAQHIFTATENSRFERPSIPTDGSLLRAVFDFYFDGGKKPRRVQVRAPNTLKLGRHCDAHLVYRWLSARGFRVTAGAAVDRGQGLVVSNQSTVISGR